MKKVIMLILMLNHIYAVDTVSKVWRVSMLSTIGTVYYTNAFKTTQSGIDVGVSEDMSMTRFNFKWLFDDNITSFYGVNIKQNTQFSFGIWSPYDRVRGEDALNHIFDISFPYRACYKNIYIEYGIGLSLMTNPHMKPYKNMGGAFAFNHILNLGINYKQFDFSLGYTHYSNNDIYSTNEGINFYLASLSYRF